MMCTMEEDFTEAAMFPLCRAIAKGYNAQSYLIVIHGGYTKCASSADLLKAIQEGFDVCPFYENGECRLQHKFQFSVIQAILQESRGCANACYIK